MTKDKDAADRETGETMLERMKALTRKVFSVSKAEIDKRAEREKSLRHSG